jgi:hypothetical protein
MDQEEFTPAKLGQRYGLAIGAVGRGEIRMRLPHTRRITRGTTQLGREAKASASQHQHAQPLNRPSHTAIHDKLLSQGGQAPAVLFCVRQ